MSDEKDTAGGRPARPDSDSSASAAPVPRGKQRIEVRSGAKSREGEAERSRNPFAVIVRFIREVVAEMKKVIWPDKRDMITYTIVVVVFIVGLVAFTTGLDLGFGKLVDSVFG